MNPIIITIIAGVVALLIGFVFGKMISKANVDKQLAEAKLVEERAKALEERAKSEAELIKKDALAAAESTKKRQNDGSKRTLPQIKRRTQ